MIKSLFYLDPEVTFLNHGSFGACPKPIFENYQHWQLELERQPVRFLQKELSGHLQASKDALASFIHCAAEDFFFTPNPTTAVNTIMRSLDLKPGDEILTTDHEYGAMDRTWRFYEKQSGVVYVRQKISLPLVSKEQILEEFWQGYSSRTKVVFINHISSATALIFPVQEICARARQLGLITIIDGAHVPGHIDLNLGELQPDYYTGTLHKWMLAPKGCSFLYVRKEHQEHLDPLVVSWGYESLSPGKSRFLDYHEQQGTRDVAAFLTAPTAIQFLKDHNWAAESQKCKQSILSIYEDFCRLMDSQPICPVTSEFLGQMCSIPIRVKDPAAFKEILYHRYQIEIPVMQIDAGFFLRISLNAYNDSRDLVRLQEALTELLQQPEWWL